MSSQCYNCTLRVEASLPHAQAPRNIRDVKFSDSRDSKSEHSGYQNTAVIRVYNFATFKDSALGLFNTKLCDRKQKTYWAKKRNSILSLLKDIFKHNFHFLVTWDINVFFKTNWIWFSKFTSKVCFVLPGTISFSIHICICIHIHINIHN
jgi:hypothetical protein